MLEVTLSPLPSPIEEPSEAVILVSMNCGKAAGKSTYVFALALDAEADFVLLQEVWEGVFASDFHAGQAGCRRESGPAIPTKPVDAT